MFLDAADQIFACARARVFGDDQEQKAKRSKKEREPLLEENPKWKLLSDVLDEIRSSNSESLQEGRILVVASDDHTCNQLREYLTSGVKSFMRKVFLQAFGPKLQEPMPSVGSGKRQGKGRGRGQPHGRGQLQGRGQPQGRRRDRQKLTSESHQKQAATRVQEDSIGESAIQGENAADKQSVHDIMTVSQAVLLVPLKGASDSYLLTRALKDHEPHYVVLYDPDMKFVRELEVYKAKRPGVPVRVYFLFYENSVEEQRYLTALRKEKDAFELLIREKASMVVPEDQDGKSGHAVNLTRDLSSPASASTNSSRKAGGRAEDAKSTVSLLIFSLIGLVLTCVHNDVYKVVVDVREFRSKLPSIVHRRGIDVEPVTLEVGDYILSPEMCVERKSVSDLISSLTSGRLYNQVVAMTRYYKRPMLLIEFDEARSFSLQPRSAVGSEISSLSIPSKLALLTLHFQKLRILWCQSPYATAELFQSLKEEQRQPDSAIAATIGTDSESVKHQGMVYNSAPQDFLLRLPGITFKNYRYVMNQVENIAQLSQMSIEKLKDLLGNDSGANDMWNFFHVKSDSVGSSKKLR
ncbi:DNA repair endonuclease XPF-like isoform X2 [Corticium candelabrum]|nr:DNA repair endonuclease XPF-like isoform X2 [Corticium candelabrum]